MARLPRYLILSDIDHIIIRGIGHMDLFFLMPITGYSLKN